MASLKEEEKIEAPTTPVQSPRTARIKKREAYSISASSLTSHHDENPPPSFNIDVLVKESELLKTKAEKRLGFSSSSSSSTSNPFTSWMRKFKWRHKGSKLEGLFSTLLPKVTIIYPHVPLCILIHPPHKQSPPPHKLKSTEDDLNLWLNAVIEQRVAATQTGMALVREMEQSVEQHQRYLDFYDEQANESLDVSFKMATVLNGIRQAVDFNDEVVCVCLCVCVRVCVQYI